MNFLFLAWPTISMVSHRSSLEYGRDIPDTVMLYNLDLNLHVRNNIIQLHSQVFNQFCSPRFENLIKYAWFKSGYVDERPPEFANPVEFCFNTCNPICDFCDVIAIIRCAWCAKSFCFDHFYKSFHYCKNFCVT